MTIGKRLRAAREKQGLTGHQLAAKTGLTATTIYTTERDEHAPLVSTLALMCDALGVTMDEIVREGER